MTANRGLDIIYPPFKDKILVFESKLAAANLPFLPFCGTRTWEEQAAIYAQGRTAPGKIVTYAQPGQSMHNYAVARDYVENIAVGHPGVEWCWDVSKDLNHDGVSDWRQMADLAHESGLEPGFYWIGKKCDPPHVQMPGLPATAVLVAWYNAGGLDRVWAELDKIYGIVNS